MHPARIRNILWMLKRNGYQTDFSSTEDADGHTHHTITAVDTEGQRWTVKGEDLDAIIAELLQQLGAKRQEDSE
jgi:hypothetical protein